MTYRISLIWSINTNVENTQLHWCPGRGRVLQLTLDGLFCVRSVIIGQLNLKKQIDCKGALRVVAFKHLFQDKWNSYLDASVGKMDLRVKWIRLYCGIYGELYHTPDEPQVQCNKLLCKDIVVSMELYLTPDKLQVACDRLLRKGYHGICGAISPFCWAISSIDKFLWKRYCGICGAISHSCWATGSMQQTPLVRVYLYLWNIPHFPDQPHSIWLTLSGRVLWYLWTYATVLLLSTGRMWLL